MSGLRTPGPPPATASVPVGPNSGRRPPSWLHRLGPMPKLAWMAGGIAFALVTYHPVPLLVLAAVAFLAAASAGVIGAVGRLLLALGPLAASILLIQAVLPAGCLPGCTPSASVGPFTLYREGVPHGVSLVARLLAMEVVTFTVTLTTRAPDLLAALDRVGVPRTLSLAGAMTLQLLPILRRELGIVLTAQRARGLRTSGPSAFARALLPVIVASVERAQQLSISLEARGFGGTARRTSYREVSSGRGDVVLAVLGAGAGLAGVIAGLAWWGPGSATFQVPQEVAIPLLAGAAGVFVLVVARALTLVRAA